MKTLFIALSLLASATTYAAPASVITQVLTDAKVAKLTEGTSLTKIEETAVYRCLGCYEFTLTQETPVGEQIIKVTTRAIGPQKVAVAVVSVTK